MLGSQNLESSDLPPQPTSSWTISSSEPAQGGKSGRAARIALEIAPPIPQASKRLRISWLLAARRIIQSDLNDNNTNSRSITATPSLRGLDSISFVWAVAPGLRPAATAHTNGCHRSWLFILVQRFWGDVIGPAYGRSITAPKPHPGCLFLIGPLTRPIMEGSCRD